MPRLLQEWLTEQAAVRPDAPAVTTSSGGITYGELDTLSTRIANTLRDAGCRRGERVALWMPKGATAIAALLGIYKADAIYVPLDAASPIKRLSAILDACESRWVLFGGPGIPALVELARDPRHAGLRVGWLDDGRPPAGLPVTFTGADVRRATNAPVVPDNGPDDAAHILFTSGSTGTPKGVVITHANVICFIEWATRHFGMNAADRVSGHPPLHFDLSFLDIFGALAAGAELHLVPPALNVLPGRMADFIRDRRLTQWFSVPSVLAYLARFDVVRHHDFPALKRVMWCGDVLSTPVLQYWMDRLPHVTFTNLYGPTETTIASSYYDVPARPRDARADVPIGAACDGEELLVLDDAMQAVSPGSVGDLYIGGVGLAQGYWRNPDQTAAAFRPHPRRTGDRIYKTGDLARVSADGVVHFLGRRDSQIKSRGYRIELGEIEAAFNTVPGIHESAVVAIDTGGFEGACICGAYVLTSGSDLTPARLRHELQQLVPDYMLPSRWLVLDRLPRTANGKTDRRELRRLFEEDTTTRAAHTA
jgi:amino acid adenylation domain-containing protein